MTSTDASDVRRAPESHPIVGARPRGGDLVWLAALTAVLVALFAWPGLVRGWTFGAGPDETVYLWWTRLGVAEGISLVGARPGVPALIATVAGALGVPLVPALAGLQQALGVSIGLASVALVHLSLIHI